MKLHRLLIFALAFPLAAHAQTTVFNDTFGNGSVLNPSNPPGGPSAYPTPTATSTGYEAASTKATTTSIAAGDLKLQIASTTSGFAEFQAQFPKTATLSADGQYVKLSVTFTPTANILFGTNAGPSSTVNLGLFNSNGVGTANAPYSGLQSSGLTTTTASAFATGGAQPWQGVNARFAYTGGTNSIISRPVQSGAGTTSANQDLLFNGAGSGAYNNPAGTSLGTSASTLTLTQGTRYTMDLQLTYNATTGLLSFNSNLSDATTGTALATINGATTDNTLPLAYDGLAIGFRYSSGTGTAPGTAITMDLNSLLVTTGTIPEPSTWAMMLGGVGMLVGMSRRVRKV